jgi:hypothetical protein
MDTLEAPRLPAAHHPSAESDTTAFCPPRMGRKQTRKKKKKPLDKGYDSSKDKYIPLDKRCD